MDLAVVGDPWDIVVDDARKAIRLRAQGNPNVLALLWLDRPLYIDLTPPGERLLEARDLFATRSTFYPFMGYARSQLMKMERGAFKGYREARTAALGRAAGYDTKNAAHLIRLLRMGIEFLRDGELQVRRPDAPELLAIKHGEWTMERVKLEAERLFRRAEDAHAASTLPDQPDPDAINALTVAVIGESPASDASDGPRPSQRRHRARPRVAIAPNLVRTVAALQAAGLDLRRPRASRRLSAPRGRRSSA